MFLYICTIIKLRLREKHKNTADFIIEKVAPIFNKKGYVATSMSDITEATGLTKGAIYFNFKNKEAIAVEAFKRNIKSMMPVTEGIKNFDNAIDKLKALSKLYGEYFQKVQSSGGCPILNVGIDSKHNNPEVYNMAKEVMNMLIGKLEKIVLRGQQEGQIKSDVNATVFAHSMYAMLEGGIFVSMVNDDGVYLQNTILNLNVLIEHLRA